MPFPKNAHKFSPVVKSSCKPDILRLLSYRNWTAQDLAVELGRTPTALSAIMRQLQELHHVHVASWHKRRNNQYVMVWGLGSKSDAPHPRACNAPIGLTRKQSKVERTKDEARLARPYVTSERVWGI